MVRILSLNVRGLGNEKKRRAIFKYCRDRADLICLQETHSTVKDEVIWTAEWGGKILFEHGESSCKGVCLLVKKGASFDISKPIFQSDGRIIICQITINDTLPICVVNIYAPNKDSPAFFQTMDTALTEMCEHKILIGDFNLTLNCEVDRLNCYTNNNKSKECVLNMMNVHMLSDTWRERNEQETRFSWERMQKSGQFAASRIDFALITRGLDAKVENITYIPATLTDHSAVVVCLQTSLNKRGPGYWKMNTLHLSNIDFQEAISQQIRTLSKKETPLQTWEALKRSITVTAKNYARGKSSMSQVIISQLLEFIDDMQTKFPLSQSDMLLYEKAKLDLDTHVQQQIQQVIFRSRCKWYEEGERNSKYFYSLERVKYNAKTCQALLQGEQLLQTDEDILNAQHAFYTDLYKEDPNVSFNLENTTDTRCPEDLKTLHEVMFSVKEVRKAVQQMKPNRTPGYDGIPYEFYKQFWSEIEEYFMEMMQFCYNQRTLFPSGRIGILNLIPKPGKDPRILKNLRPITLLNCDYKIIEKCIANRLTEIAENIVHPDQKGFMPNRRISANIRKILDIISYCENEKGGKEGLLLNLDLEKAFDKLAFEAIYGSLRYFNTAEYLINWIQVLYTDFELKIQNNGKFSESLRVERGTHQGGVCSAQIFVIAMELIAIDLRANEQILGINIQTVVNILNQFADDTDVTLENDQESLQKTIDTFERYHHITGLKVSYDKTSVYRLGSLRKSKAQLYTQPEIKWTSSPITILGIVISHDVQEQLDLNYQQVYDKMCNVIRSWSTRSLTLMGKICIVNTLVASLFVHRMMVLPTIPKSIVKRVYSVITNFIWNNRKAKIAMHTLQASKKMGGLQLVNLILKDKVLKISWIQILHNDEHTANIAYASISAVVLHLKNLIWKCNLHQKDVKLFCPHNLFWKDVLEAWCSVNFDYSDGALDQILWCNSYVRVDNSPVFWEVPFKKGLVMLSQLFSNNEWIGYDEAQRLYNLNFMQFNSLKDTIPNQWKKSPTGVSTHALCLYEQLKEKKNLSSYLYRTLLEEEQPNLKAEKWEKILAEEIPHGTMLTAHKNIYGVTNVPKYRGFLYR